MLQVIPIPALKDNYIWTIVHPNTQQCVIVDPGEAAPVLETINRLNLVLKAILITHHHWDHTAGIETIHKEFPCMVIAPALENVPCCQRKVQQDDVITIPEMGLTLKVLDIPGHTRGHVAYYGHGMAFTGDTLFTAGCGKIFEGTPQQMWDSLHKLMALPDDTLIYCGHEYTQSNLQFATTVEPNNVDIIHRIETTAALRAKQKPTVPAPLSLEKRTNPFLRTEINNVQQAIKAHFDSNLDSPIALFAALRAWKNTF